MSLGRWCFGRVCGISLVLYMFFAFRIQRRALFGATKGATKGVTKSATKSAFRIHRKAFRIHIFQGRNNTNFIAFVDVWG